MDYISAKTDGPDTLVKALRHGFASRRSLIGTRCAGNCGTTLAESITGLGGSAAESDGAESPGFFDSRREQDLSVFSC